MRDSIVKQLTALALVAAACGLPACGGGDKSSNSTQAAQGQTQTSPGTRSGGSGGSGGSGAPQSNGQRASSTGGSPRTGSGGARAPRVQRARQRRTLLRYLASRYRLTPWYPLLQRLDISGSHVGVHLDFSPADDDENPPVMACQAVLSYGRQVKRVTVYGNPTPQGELIAMKTC